MNQDPATNPQLKAAWEKYYASIDTARRELESTARFRDQPEHRAQAYYSLAEAQAMAYNFAIAPRADRPLVHTHSWYHYYYTLGGTSPDFYYGTLFLDGRKSYRLTGRFGELKMILLQGFSHILGHEQSKMLGNFDIAMCDIGPDGTFDVVISATRRERNWIPLDPDSDYNFFFVRRAVGDWYDDRGTLDIQMIDAPDPDSELSETAIAKRVSYAADFLLFLVRMWNVGIYDMYLKQNDGVKNALKVVPGSSIAADFIGSPTTIYIWGVYQIEDDEALIIECEVSGAHYWSIQVFDVWCKPFDFIHRQTDINLTRAVVDKDGKWRAVIALRDPGVANWLDCAGRREGTIVGRNYHPVKVPADPVLRVVKLAELRAHLPADTRYVTPEERKQALDYRKRGWFRLYGE